MRSILKMALLISVFNGAPGVAWSQENVALQSKMDSNLKAIIETLATSVVKGFPVLGQSKLTVNENSPLEQGLIQGNFEIQTGTEGGMSTSTGQIDIALKTSPNAGKVDIHVTTTGKVATPQLIQALEAANQSLCVGVSSSDCQVIPLLDFNDSALPVGQQGAMAFIRFQENLVSYLTSYIEQAGPSKKRQTFGEASDDTASTGALSAETAEELRLIILQSLSISISDNGAVVTFDTNQVRTLGADLAAVNPGIAFLSSFETVQIDIVGAEASYTLTTSNEVSARVISTYDAYIQQEQAKPDGLKSVNELVGAMGLWLVEFCGAADRQAECVDKFMVTCARDVAHVESCVGQVQKLKAGREAKQNGDFVGAGLNAAGGYVDGELQKAGDGISDFFGWVFGAPPQQP